ncbi:MAG: DNA-protecting protein DprA [Planctomycetaceae bacterium]|nr:DNA-processing protein DprA [Planctomycetales bacterium]MCB9923185.1 DNA-protecting protein DprA [Planctomycetaceae bacterium]
MAGVVVADGVESTGDTLEAAVRLSLVPGVGPRTRKTLLECLGSAEAVFDAAPSVLRQVPGVGPKLVRAISDARSNIDVAAEMELCRENDIALIADADDRYPKLLGQIHDPPGILYVKGEIIPADGLAIAIVGTRHSTQYGLQQAERLAAGLARAGLTIVSGLARGIDAAAHRSALQAGGRTLAVLGSGLLNIYPPEHRELSRQVIEHGALISEMSPHSPPASGAFPQRNRIVTGLSMGVIVVEAALRSGALISAEHAMQQGREVFAVPGRVDSRASHGCHRLLREGAKLVESVDDVLEELGPLFASTTSNDGREVRHPAELQLNDQEQAVLDAIQKEATSIDQVVSVSGLPIHRVLSTISVLEMRRLVRRISGNQVSRY